MVQRLLRRAAGSVSALPTAQGLGGDLAYLASDLTEVCPDGSSMLGIGGPCATHHLDSSARQPGALRLEGFLEWPHLVVLG